MAVSSRHFLRPQSFPRALDARGRGAGVAYDGDGRPTGRRYPDGARVTLAYDAVGNRTLAQDLLGRYTTTFDSLDRARTTTTPANKTITYAYDAGSQRRYMIDPDGGRFTYAFDAVGRNSLVVNPQSERTTWTFDAGGRTTVQQLANGCRASYAYDSGNRLLRLANLKSDGTTLSSFRDAWDNSGNRTSRVEADGVRVTWSYDNTYQLTREQRSGGNAYDIQYAYDSASNRRTKLENSITTTYAYDAANQLTTLKDNTGTTTFTFDASGNQQIELTPAAARTTNAWDYENRLTKVQLPASVVNTFAYNADNLRVKTQDSTGTLKQIWDDQKVLAETDGSDVTQATYSLSSGFYGDLVSQRRGAATAFYLFDPLGSTDKISDGGQTVTASYVFQAFGKLIASTGATVNPWRYLGGIGYAYLVDTDALYVRRRQLGAALGRWQSIDPLTSVADYLYVLNRPSIFIDPTGEEPCMPPGQPAPPPPPKYCNQEIGMALWKTLQTVRKKFKECVPWYKKIYACNNPICWRQWDFNFSGDAPCGNGKECQECYMVNGKKHWQWAINYSLFGLLMALCGRSFEVAYAAAIAHKATKWELDEVAHLFNWLQLGWMWGNDMGWGFDNLVPRFDDPRFANCQKCPLRPRLREFEFDWFWGLGDPTKC